MTSVDKDFRFMATNDLMSELQNDSIKLDDDSERKVSKYIISFLQNLNKILFIFKKDCKNFTKITRIQKW